MIQMNFLFVQLRVQIMNNFQNQKNCPLSEKNWGRLDEWRWNTKFGEDRALTKTVCVSLILFIESIY